MLECKAAPALTGLTISLEKQLVTEKQGPQESSCQQAPPGCKDSIVYKRQVDWESRPDLLSGMATLHLLPQLDRSGAIQRPSAMVPITSWTKSRGKFYQGGTERAELGQKAKKAFQTRKGR